ncbi:DNA translocase FtsK [Staphylococcus agnetis]|uniref:DNA translocase FtsK n=1 Tax=Staphylococcus agnetis TaxID=985762 RepID=UPI0021D254CB|nr:DNA translocase FtsK [Staphylococcus agnetis]UXU60517.1 DNA translocase FtsK [Staphylococcus agnetis]UXU62850.1 DNA translocase FtsK [Staphylococcus agnetis]
MSWFDKLFGEETPSDRTSSEKKRSTVPKKSRHDLIPQTNDVYQRPRGKFRFPITMDYDISDREEQRNDSVTLKKRDIEGTERVSYGVDRKTRRHRTHGFSKTKATHVYQSNRTRPSQQHASQLFQGTIPNDKTTKTHHQRPHKEMDHYKGSSTTTKSIHKANYAKPTTEFKASEVPSAIFGTQERKSIKNSGLNQPPGTRSKTTQPPAKSLGERKKTPNHSKRDNTINIENIYASQIVDEIRREREKKIQQKKRFKEALQHKRALKDEDPHADIQKAIDKMHASQARQLLGKDYEEADLEEHLEPNEAVTPEANEDVESLDQAQTESDIQYEEIDLSQIHLETDAEQTLSSDKVNTKDNDQAYEFDDVQTRTKSQQVHNTHRSTSNVIDDENEQAVNDNVDITINDDHLNQDVASPLDDTNNQSDTSARTFNASNENYVEDAENINTIKNDIQEGSKKSNSRDESSINVDVPQLSHDRVEENSTTQPDEIEVTKTEARQIVPPLKPEQKQTQNANKVPIRKGSKPFNVVMTPSDKKRMMERRKHEHLQRQTIKNTMNQTTSRDIQATQQNLQNDHTQQSSERVHSPEIVTTSQVNTDTKEEEKKIRRGPVLNLPSIDLLDQPEIHEKDNAWIEEKKQQLNDAFFYFNVPAEVVNVIEGPSVTRFELSVERGVKVSRITALQDDIKMALAAKDIRIEAPIPGTSLVGIEVPNQHPTKVNLRSILETPAFKHAESKLTVAMGNRINNEPLLMDIAKTPHALIAGATGSGKSVSINSILLSLLYRNHPEELKLLLIDPKMVELAPYNDLPHLVAPVITDVKAATQSLKWAVEEMERRYKLFAQTHVRNITAFNKKVNYDQRMPKIVIVIDELADLMMMAPQDVEQSIARIAQKARACGIHMLVATQRPSVNVITGLIKANIPTRIAFMVSSSVDSRTILDSGGAERLLGYGDMLYLGGGMNKPIRVQGTFVSDEEIDEVVEYIKSQREPEYLFQEKELLKKTEEPTKDELFNEVCEFMVKERHISTSLIQRHFQIGYNRAARIIDQLEQLGYISGANGSKPRDVFLTEADLQDS